MVIYTCPTCNKEFNRKCNFIDHTENKKKPCKPKNPKYSEIFPTIPKHSKNPNSNEDSEIKESFINKDNKDNKDNICEYCDKKFSTGFNLNKHIKYNCKIKKSQDEEKKLQSNQLDEFKKLILEQSKQIEELKKQKTNNIIINNNTDNITKKELYDINKNLKKLEDMVPITEKKINNQLINIIIDKEKQIDELVNNKKDDNLVSINNQDKDKIIVSKPLNLIINNEVIVYRESDKYINATQLCKAGGKKFSHWFSLDSTKELINELGKNIYNSNVQNNTLEKSNIESEAGIPASLSNIQNNIKLIDVKKGNSINFEQGTWIHPDLAIQLAQWISPQFALQVSSWIRTLFTNGKVEANIQLLKEKDKRIKLLEDLTLEKQKRNDYIESNVIYLLTTEDNKKKRIYIIGKALNLKNRLSTYNKSVEHEVIYHKSCKNKKHMEVVERMVFLKLEEYKEKANRDRFILPLEHDIKFFTKII